MQINYKNLVLVTLLQSQFLYQISATLAFTKCSLNDSECLTTQARIVLQNFTNGIPELGIEKLDVLDLGDIHLQGDGIDYNTTNTMIEGLKNSTIDNVSIDMRLKMIRLFTITTFTFDADYEVTGNYLSIPLFGKGKAKLIKKNVRFNILIWFEIKKENGKSFIHVNKHHYGFDIRDGAIYNYGNVFNGDKVRAENLHNFLNSNWLIISTNYTKLYFDHIVKRIVNAIKIYLAANALEDIASYP